MLSLEAVIQIPFYKTFTFFKNIAQEGLLTYLSISKNLSGRRGEKRGKTEILQIFHSQTTPTLIISEALS